LVRLTFDLPDNRIQREVNARLSFRPPNGADRLPQVAPTAMLSHSSIEEGVIGEESDIGVRISVGRCRIRQCKDLKDVEPIVYGKCHAGTF
jgi:hypothetical protein